MPDTLAHMRKLALLIPFALAACPKSREDYKDQKPPEPEPAAKREEAPPPPKPVKKALTPEEMGKCTLKATGSVEAEVTSQGGRQATNVSYWFTEAERNSMMGVDGFAVNCSGPDLKFAIVPGGGKKDGMPFEPKKYTFKNGKGDASLAITLGGGKKTLDAINGTVDITAFDKHHIAGTVDLSGKLVPGGGSEKITGEFDYVCPGFSGCE
jgi:hypothetical protein